MPLNRGDRHLDIIAAQLNRCPGSTNKNMQQG